MKIFGYKPAKVIPNPILLLVYVITLLVRMTSAFAVHKKHFTNMREVVKMKQIVTIKGKPVIEIDESFDGSYWYVTEKAWKQDSLIDGKVYQRDQIFFGYTKLASYPDGAEFGYFSEAQLKQLGWGIWKVHKHDWPFCPDVEVEEVADAEHPVGEAGGTVVPHPSSAATVCQEVASQ